MTDKHTENKPAKLSAREATAAKPVKGMPLVLGISITAVVILFVVVLAMFI